MSRIRSIVVPLAVIAIAALIAGCGGSSKDATTSSVAVTTTPTTPATTATTPTTDTSKTTPTTTTPTSTTNIPNLSDAPTNKGGLTVGKATTLTAANGGVLKVTVTKRYDIVKSVTNFDVAPKGLHYVGVTLTASYTGRKEGVTSSVLLTGDDGSQLSTSLLADPDCGRNLVNLALLGLGIGKHGCIVGLAPKGVKPKQAIIILRSGKDRSTKAEAKVPL